MTKLNIPENIFILHLSLLVENRDNLFIVIIMFSVGGILDAKKLNSNNSIRTTIEALAGRCRSVHYHKRPRAKEALTCLKDLCS